MVGVEKKPEWYENHYHKIEYDCQLWVSLSNILVVGLYDQEWLKLFWVSRLKKTNKQLKIKKQTTPTF